MNGQRTIAYLHLVLQMIVIGVVSTRPVDPQILYPSIGAFMLFWLFLLWLMLSNRKAALVRCLHWGVVIQIVVALGLHTLLIHLASDHFLQTQVGY